ncbi:MAG: class I SAM-dependent methyltransferase, partial [Candidatus Kariarchaeaceae archaeon]
MNNNSRSANEPWNSSDLYDDFMGKWSQLLAGKFLCWLKDYHSIEQKKWLDVGCGTGALTFEIVENTHPKKVLGIDPSDHYLPRMQANNGKIRFKVGTADRLPISDMGY